MARKKKSKGVMERIGDAATSAAGVVIDAGSKAIRAVGSMMPTGTPQSSAKAAPKAARVKRARKASAKSSKASAKASKAPKKVAAMPKAAAPKAQKAAMKKTTPTKSAKPAVRTARSPKAKRSTGKKG